MIKNPNLFERLALLGGADCGIYGYTSKQLETVFENCNDLELVTEGKKVDITEKGATVMSVPIAGTSTLKFTAETTTFSKLAMALGSAGFKLNSKADTYQVDKTFTVTSTESMIFNLDVEAVSKEDVSVVLATSDNEIAKRLAFTIDETKKIITVTADPDIAVGDRIRINYSSVVAIGKMYKFDVPSVSKSTAKRVVIDAVGINKVDQSKVLFQIEIHKVSVTEGITLKFSGTDATSFEISMSVLADEGRNTGEEGSQFYTYKMLTDASVLP